MAAPFLQLVSGSDPLAVDGVERFTAEVARALGGAVLRLSPHRGTVADHSVWDGLSLLTPAPGEGALAAWHRALDQTQPGAVFVQHLGAVNPALLLDLRERAIPYAVFLHDFTPLCPTHQLWHRRQERCSGPGRTGWKCAWCVSGTRRRAIELPVRTLLYRHRPQDWRTALVRAEALIAPSRFSRDFWIEQGAPPERIAVIPPFLPPGDGAPHSRLPRPAPSEMPRILYPGGWGQAPGAELLAAALDSIRRPILVEVPDCPDPAARAAFRDALAPRHRLVFLDTAPPPLSIYHLVVIPARWDQPYSRLAADAQQAGAPVVATAVGGLTEQIIHGVNGYLAAPDDPVAFADSLQEALAPETRAWGGDRMGGNVRAASTAALARLRLLLRLLLEGDADPALALEHNAWLAAEATAAASGTSATEVASKLIAALRRADGEHAADDSSRDRFAARAWALTRQRRVELNHALAFFRACGCRRIAHLGDARSPAEDAADWFHPWGLETVAAEELPDGLFLQADEPLGMTDTARLRRRFPQAKALVAFTPAGVDTLAWDEEDAADAPH